MRIDQNRQQPIDRFVQVLWIYKDKLRFDAKAEDIMAEPKNYLVKLQLAQLEEILQSIAVF